MILRPRAGYGSAPTRAPLTPTRTPLPFEGRPLAVPGQKYPMPLGARAPLGSFRHGGKVKKTGTYKLHAGERVVPVRGVKDVESHEYNFRKKKRG